MRTSVRLLLAVLWLAPALQGCAGAKASDPPRANRARSLFSDITASAGIRFRHSNGMAKALHPNLLQTTGSGCGLFDYDGDGRLDLYLIDGDHGKGDGNRLYRNEGDGTFRDVTERAGVRGHGYGMGCAAADYDGDGDVDLYVANYGPNLLFRNNGDGTFSDVTKEAGVAVPQWSTVAAFFDANGDGHLDLYVGQYVKFNENSRQLCETAGVMGGCNPAEYESEHDVLFIGNGKGGFRDGTRLAGIRDENGRALGVLVDDFDADGRPDIFVANDGSANFLFHNQGGGRFKDVGVGAGIAYGLGGRGEASMGCDSGDYDADGHLDLVIGNFEGETSAVYRNLGQGLFQYATAPAGLATPTIPVLTFGIGFLDYDNDGDLDLAQANGHVHPLIETVDPEAPYRQARQLFENLGSGTFRDASAQAGPEFTALTVGRGMAFGDIDNDGDVDIVTNNNGEAAVLLRNEAHTGNHWLGVSVTGAPPTYQPMGARVIVDAGGKRLVRTVRTSYSFASANDSRVHYGLGSHAGPVSVVVEWPGGRRTNLGSVTPDRYITIRPGGS